MRESVSYIVGFTKTDDLLLGELIDCRLVPTAVTIVRGRPNSQHTFIEHEVEASLHQLVRPDDHRRVVAVVKQSHRRLSKSVSGSSLVQLPIVNI